MLLDIIHPAAQSLVILMFCVWFMMESRYEDLCVCLLGRRSEMNCENFSKVGCCLLLFCYESKLK